MINDQADISRSSPFFFIHRSYGIKVGSLIVIWLSSLVLPHLCLADSHNTDKRWSVLLITVDSMRPDHMSVYGYERNTTPNLQRFAQEALVFENAFATSAWTSPGIVSMLTGYYPPVHGQNGQFSFYDAEMASPVRLFVELGYDASGQAIKGPTHANLGFERSLKKKHGLEDFIQRQSLTKEPFFAWIHTKETHLPYAPTERNPAQRARAGADGFPVPWWSHAAV